jgi:hypothetical protein
MRLSVLALAAVLLIPAIVFAQHAGSAPSAPPPSPPPSAAPSPPPPPPTPPPPSPAPPAPSAAPSVSVSHSSAPSVPSPASVPESHVTAGPSSSSRTSGSSAGELDSGRAAQTSHAPEADAQRIVPDQKISGESRIVAAPRIGDKPPEKEGEAKKDEPDWRRRICDNGVCKEPPLKPEPPESGLRRAPCLKGQCPCPPGETATKGGCVAPVNPPTPCQPGLVTNGVDCTSASTSCPAGQSWNGTRCVPSTQCPAGEVWNGASCMAATSECLSYESRAAATIAELRNLRSEVQQACGQNPSGQKCMDLKQDQQLAFGRYDALWNEAPTSCRVTLLPDPGSLI